MVQRKILRLTKSRDKRHLAHIQVQLGRSYYAKGEVKPALKRLKTALYLDKQCTEAYLFLGDIYYEQGQTQKAVSVWEDMIKRGVSFSALAYRRLEEAYLTQNRYDKIKQIYQEVLRNNPADVRTHLALAKYHEQQGKLDLAQAQLKEALKYHPQSLPVRQYLLQLLISSQSQKLAQEYRGLFGEFKLEALAFSCTKCGYETLDSPWKCPRCQEWDTFEDPLAKPHKK